MTATALRRSTPSDAGVDAAAVTGFLDALTGAGIEAHSLMLLRHGAVVAEAHWAPYEAGQVNLLYSLSKSFTSVAAGIAMGEKRFQLDDRIVDLVPELVPDDVADTWRRVTVRDCLRMATGHLDDPEVHPGEGDVLAAFLRLPPESEPGSVFTYNQLATYTIARLVESSIGLRLLDYLRQRLFEPIGIGPAAWLTDGHGHDFGFSGLHVSTDAIARLGQLLLQRGRWDARQLVPADWVELATSPQMPNDGAHRKPGVEEPTFDWGHGYGFQFWMCRNGFRGDGAYGQFCVVLPEQDAVLAMTAETTEMQTVLDAVWEHLLPGLSGAGSGSGDAVLADRLAAPTIAPPPDDAGGAGTESLRRTGGDAAPSIDSVQVEADGEHWVAVLSSGQRSWRLPIGRGTWLAGVWDGDPGLPFRCAGGWLDGVFRAELRMIRTPHVIQLVVDPARHTVEMRWRQPPLHGLEPADHSISAP
ncbi:serine hydrolase domain-containing protein [Flexivirga sp. B27]